MTSLTFDVFALAPLFGTAGVSDSPFVFLLIGLILYVAFLCGSRRLVDDIFKNDSPAQSPKRLVPWNVGTALVVFICCAFVLPLLAAKTIAALPKSCFPDFASVQVDAENEQANADGPNKLATQHPIVRLLARSRSTPWAFETFLLCFFVAVIAAPVAEEFLFRTLFQGTLENYALQAILPPPGTPRRPL
ncbi:MAG: hypothetical protein IJO46_04415, partial [Thermoguttaceae bacterium]|nr:hypothetical protein [Thermoguttaceae bacterium]